MTNFSRSICIAIVCLAVIAVPQLASGMGSAAWANQRHQSARQHECHGTRHYDRRVRRCVCSRGQDWNGKHCVQSPYYDNKRRLLDGYRRGQDGKIYQDNGGGE